MNKPVSKLAIYTSLITVHTKTTVGYESSTVTKKIQNLIELFTICLLNHRLWKFECNQAVPNFNTIGYGRLIAFGVVALVH